VNCGAGAPGEPGVLAEVFPPPLPSVSPTCSVPSSPPALPVPGPQPICSAQPATDVAKPGPEVSFGIAKNQPSVPMDAGNVGAPLDALAQAPEAIWYVRPPSGGQYGPASSKVMQAWLAEGRITPDSQVWREGWKDWRQAIEVFPESAFPQLRIADAVPGLEHLLEAPGSIHSGPIDPRFGRIGGRSALRQVLIILAFLVMGMLGAGLAYLGIRFL